MPQPKQPKAPAAKAAATSPAAAPKAARKKAAPSKASSPAKGPSTAGKGAAKPSARKRKAPAATRPAAKPAPAPEPTSAAARDEALRANLASLRDLLAGGVVLTAQRIQEAVNDAVTRGRMTRRDAEDLATGLVSSGRQQTADLLADLEQVLGRGRSDLTSARAITKGAVKGSSERALREVDRARRAAGMGPSFPILGYDELTAAQVVARLTELTPAELRKVRTYERRTHDRATVLKAIEKRLG